MFRFIVLALLAVLVTLFGLSNLQVVELRTVFAEEVRASLAFLLLGAFASGFTIATLLNMHRNIQVRRRDRAHYQQLLEASPLLLPAPPQVPARPNVQRRFRLFGSGR